MLFERHWDLPITSHYVIPPSHCHGPLLPAGLQEKVSSRSLYPGCSTIMNILNSIANPSRPARRPLLRPKQRDGLKMDLNGGNLLPLRMQRQLNVYIRFLEAVHHIPVVRRTLLAIYHNPLQCYL